MRKFLLVVLVGLSVTIAKGQRYDTIRYAKDHYAKRVTLFKSEPLIKGRVIFLGNSITEFGDWKKLLNDTTVINRGIAADNTFGVLERLNDIILRQPRKLFLKVGINDIQQGIPVDIIAKNIFLIVERVKAKSPQTEIYVHSVLPTNDNVKNEYPQAFNKSVQINSVNDLLKQQAKKNHFTYVDLNKELSDKDGKLNVKYADPDGLHLNEVGYQVWVNLLRTKKYL